MIFWTNLKCSNQMFEIHNAIICCPMSITFNQMSLFLCHLWHFHSLFIWQSTGSFWANIVNISCSSNSAPWEPSHHDFENNSRCCMMQSWSASKCSPCGGRQSPSHAKCFWIWCSPCNVWFLMMHILALSIPPWWLGHVDHHLSLHCSWMTNHTFLFCPLTCTWTVMCFDISFCLMVLHKLWSPCPLNQNDVSLGQWPQLLVSKRLNFLHFLEDLGVILCVPSISLCHLLNLSMNLLFSQWTDAPFCFQSHMCNAGCSLHVDLWHFCKALWFCFNFSPWVGGWFKFNPCGEPALFVNADNFRHFPIHFMQFIKKGVVTHLCFCVSFLLSPCFISFFLFSAASLIVFVSWDCLSSPFVSSFSFFLIISLVFFVIFFLKFLSVSWHLLQVWFEPWASCSFHPCLLHSCSSPFIVFLFFFHSFALQLSLFSSPFLFILQLPLVGTHLHNAAMRVVHSAIGTTGISATGTQCQCDCTSTPCSLFQAKQSKRLCGVLACDVLALCSSGACGDSTTLKCNANDNNQSCFVTAVSCACQPVWQNFIVDWTRSDSKWSKWWVGHFRWNSTCLWHKTKNSLPHTRWHKKGPLWVRPCHWTMNFKNASRNG